MGKMTLGLPNSTNGHHECVSAAWYADNMMYIPNYVGIFTLAEHKPASVPNIKKPLEACCCRRLIGKTYYMSAL